ncbi:small-subunit processome [Mycena sp. CBHHK59/15]|nr:small-subunit processome [Mycena sp. CBHHK59/15]
MPLKNSLHRRNHKERSQLAHRARLGILEKHADYVKRARDYHSKQDRITRLKQKVADRNKDEFYFSMTKQATKGGVHLHDRGNVALPQDIVKVLKTQDENYVRTMRSAGLKKIDKIKAQLTAMADLMKSGSLEDEDDMDDLDDDEIKTLQDAGIIPKRKGKGRAQAKHIVFVENEDEARQYASSSRTTLDVPIQNPTAAADSEPMDLGWKVPSKKSKQRDSAPAEDADAVAEILSDERRVLASANRKRLLKELSARLFRDTQLRHTEREFEMQRQLMGKGARRKIAGVEAVEGGDDDDDMEDEDEVDARRGKRKETVRKVDPKTYKPRVYKWRLERKR